MVIEEINMRKSSFKNVILFGVIATIVIGGVALLTEKIGYAETTPTRGAVLYVGGSGPDNYTHIQDALDDASSGDTVYVFNGTYYEHVVMNKSINLIGENKDNTVVDGSGSGTVITITVNHTNMSEFTLQNGGSGSSDAGLKIDNCHYCNISNINCSNNGNYGIYLVNSEPTIHNAVVYNNSATGINISYNTLGYNTYTSLLNNLTVCNNTGYGIEMYIHYVGLTGFLYSYHNIENSTFC